jgi:regulator of protease activity HflC (stomatin/prohibitin superfamily)
MFFLKLVLLLAVIGWTIFKGVRTSRDAHGRTLLGGLDKTRLTIGIAAVVLILVSWSSVGSVEAGYRGVVTRFGAVTGRVLPEGIYAVMPLAETVEQMDVQVGAEKKGSDAASRDLQRVATEVTLNYYLDPNSVHLIYQTLRRDAVPRIIDPAIQEAVKAATAHYNAEQLITERETVKGEIESSLRTRLASHHIIVDTVSITDFKFTDVFNDSIEAKVKATQEALRAQNELERVKMEAAQKVEQAKAEAESLRLQRAEITPEMLRLRMIEAQTKAIDKWNGQLPQQMFAGGDGAAPVPIVDVFRSR